MNECVDNEFRSFNEFFIRRLRSEHRPQDQNPNILTVPADGRYSLFPIIGTGEPFLVKGEQFSLANLLHSKALAAQFLGGVGVIARLCPCDCHRFYFPCAGISKDPVWIPGSLFSVNPIATRKRPWIWWSNRRILTLIHTEHVGTIAYLEVGATNCGSIIQNFVPNSLVTKGQEKGYFRIGGSALILLFEPDKVELVPDLQELASHSKEIYCQIGQPLVQVISCT